MSVELPENEDSENAFKKFLHVCEQKCNAKCTATPFSWGGGRGTVGEIGTQR
jgi:hypothetical protein